MSPCVHDMMWTNVFSRFESIYRTNVHGFLDMRIYYHLWVDLHSASPQISKSNQPNLSCKLYQIVGVSWILMAEQPSRKKQLHRQFNFRDLSQENLRSEIVSNLSIHTPRGFLPGRFSGFLQNGKHPIRFEMWKSGKI